MTRDDKGASLQKQQVANNPFDNNETRPKANEMHPPAGEEPTVLQSISSLLMLSSTSSENEVAAEPQPFPVDQLDDQDPVADEPENDTTNRSKPEKEGEDPQPQAAKDNNNPGTTNDNLDEDTDEPLMTTNNSTHPDDKKSILEKHDPTETETTHNEEDLLPASQSGVSFSTVQVHTHRLTLGDNPGKCSVDLQRISFWGVRSLVALLLISIQLAGVSSGVPLTLGWDVEESESFANVEDFEKTHQSKRNKYNPTGLIGPTARQEIASAKHSRESITKVTSLVKDIKQSRRVNAEDKQARQQRRPTGMPIKKKNGLFFLKWFQR